MDKYGKALAVVCLVGAEDAVKASEFKNYTKSDAFFVGAGRKASEIEIFANSDAFSAEMIRGDRKTEETTGRRTTRSVPMV